MKVRWVHVAHLIYHFEALINDITKDVSSKLTVVTCVDRYAVKKCKLVMYEEDYPDYSPSVRFEGTPSATSIENTLQMAKVLRAKGEIQQALNRFYIVCESIESAIAMNPGARIELHPAIFAIREIADIYEDRKDWTKSLAFRNTLNSFLKFLQAEKQGNRSHSDVDDDLDGENFVEIMSKSVTYKKLFQEYHAAKAVPDLKIETPEEILKKLQDAREKDEQAKMERIIKLFEEAADERENELKNSFFKRLMQKITDHPFIFISIVIFIALVIVLFVKYMPKKKFEVPGGIDAQMAYLEKYMEDYNKKHGRETPRKPENDMDSIRRDFKNLLKTDL